MTDRELESSELESGAAPGHGPERETQRSPQHGGLPDPLEPFNTRLPRSLQRRLKVHAALHEVKIQDVLSAALSDYLSARGS